MKKVLALTLVLVFGATNSADAAWFKCKKNRKSCVSCSSKVVPTKSMVKVAPKANCQNGRCQLR